MSLEENEKEKRGFAGKSGDISSLNWNLHLLLEHRKTASWLTFSRS